MSGWKSIVGAVAPALATALGGPLAGLATTALTKALGLGSDSTEDQLAKAVSTATPEQLLAIKQAEQDFMVNMKELDVDLERIAMADRTSARKREADTGDSWTPRVLATLVIILFGYCLWWAFTGRMNGMDAAAMSTIGGVIGYASAKADTVIGYYFGSSASWNRSQSNKSEGTK